MDADKGKAPPPKDILSMLFDVPDGTSLARPNTPPKPDQKQEDKNKDTRLT